MKKYYLTLLLLLTCALMMCSKTDAPSFGCCPTTVPMTTTSSMTYVIPGLTSGHSVTKVWYGGKLLRQSSAQDYSWGLGQNQVDYYVTLNPPVMGIGYIEPYTELVVEFQ